MKVAELMRALEEFDRDAEVYICLNHPWLAMRAEAVRRMSIQYFHEEEEDFQIEIDAVLNRK